MTARGRLRDELRRLGNSPIPVLDPGRAQQLERRVLGATRHRELVDAEAVDARRTSRRRSAVVALALACVVAIAVIGSVDRTRSLDRILFASGDVEVVLPDGSVVDGTTGMVLPDGSILRLGQRAEARVDGITVSSAGSYRVTRDGLTLLTASNPPASPAPPAPPATTGAGAPTTVAPGSPAVATVPRRTEPDPTTTSVRPTTTTQGDPTTTSVRPTTTTQEPHDNRLRPTTTVRDTATPVVRPPTSQRVAPPPPADSLATRPTPPPAPSTTTRPDTTPPPSGTAAPNGSPARLDVAVGSDGRRVVLGWLPVVGATGYLVTALPGVTEGASSWPPAPGVEITELLPGTLQFSVTRLTDGAWSYRVAAVGRNDRTLALSRVITIEG